MSICNQSSNYIVLANCLELQFHTLGKVDIPDSKTKHYFTLTQTQTQTDKHLLVQLCHLAEWPLVSDSQPAGHVILILHPLWQIVSTVGGVNMRTINKATVS